jgi:hypothetical protein
VKRVRKGAPPPPPAAEEQEPEHPCRERQRCDGTLCEMRAVYCPLCGSGPRTAGKMHLYPVCVNHVPIWCCSTCFFKERLRACEMPRA